MMPKVGKTKFPYTAKGMADAKKMAKAEGEPMKMHQAEMGAAKAAKKMAGAKMPMGKKKK